MWLNIWFHQHWFDTIKYAIKVYSGCKWIHVTRRQNTKTKWQCNKWLATKVESIGTQKEVGEIIMMWKFPDFFLFKNSDYMILVFIWFIYSDVDHELVIKRKTISLLARTCSLISLEKIFMAKDKGAFYRKKIWP